MTPEQITRNFICDPAIIDDAKRAVSGLDSYPALSRVLQANPLQTLTFTDSHRALFDVVVANSLIVPDDLRASDDQVSCGGFYNGYKNIVGINAGYKHDTRIQAMAARHSNMWRAVVVPQISFTVPISQLDTATLIHEVSHMIDAYVVRESNSLCRFMSEAAQSAYGSQRFVSKYAGTSPEEWFAETMSAYVIHPEVLKEFDPLGFAAMRAALEL